MYAAMVLAGGEGRRLGGRDKAALTVGGRPLLARVLAAVADASPRIVVGPPRPDLPAGVLVTREDPPGGGPVAGVAAGLALVPDDVRIVVVLAADLPFLDPPHVRAIVAAVDDDADGAVLVDDADRRQLLCGAWRTPALRHAVDGLGDPSGAPMRRLLGGLHVVEVPATADPPPWWDVDTDADLRRAEDRA